MLLWTIVPGVDSTNDGPQGTSHDPDILGPRIVVTATWAIGVLHMFLVVKTFLTWSGAGITVNFDQQRVLEEGRGSASEMAPEVIQLPSGLRRIPNPQTPPVPLQTAAPVSSIRAEIPLAREEDEEDILVGDITPQVHL